MLLTDIDFVIGEDDLLPTVRGVLRDEAGNPMQGLAGAQVRFVMEDDSGDVAKVDDAAAIVDADTAVVEYTWQQGDTDTPGQFRAYWMVTFPGNKQTRFPNDHYYAIQITPRLQDYTQVARLRRVLGERVRPSESDLNSFWTNAELQALLDSAQGSMELAAYWGWQEKAAWYAKRVDVSESGSTRNLSQLFKNATYMVNMHRPAAMVQISALNTPTRVVGRAIRVWERVEDNFVYVPDNNGNPVLAQQPDLASLPEFHTWDENLKYYPTHRWLPAVLG